MKQKFLLDSTKHHKKQQPFNSRSLFFFFFKSSSKKWKVRGKYAATLPVQVSLCNRVPKYLLLALWLVHKTKTFRSVLVHCWFQGVWLSSVASWLNSNSSQSFASLATSNHPVLFFTVPFVYQFKKKKKTATTHKHTQTHTQIIAYAADAGAQPLAQESATCQDCVRQKWVGVGLCVSPCAVTGQRSTMCCYKNPPHTHPSRPFKSWISLPQTLHSFHHCYSDGAPIWRDLL